MNTVATIVPQAINQNSLATWTFLFTFAWILLLRSISSVRCLFLILSISASWMLFLLSVSTLI